MACLVCEVHVEVVFASCVGCTVATTKQQPQQTAEPETAVSAKTFH